MAVILGGWCRLLLIGLLSLVTSCGFQLRCDIDSLVGFVALDVSATHTYGQLATEMTRTLAQQGITVNPKEGADYRLHLLGERASRRAISTTNQVTVAEYLLQLTVDFELLNSAGDSVLPVTSLMVERVYSFDRGSFVGSSEEEAVLSREMQIDVIQQILRRVDAALNDVKTAAVNRVSVRQ